MSNRVIVCKASPVQDEAIDSVTIEISRDIDETAEAHGGGPKVMSIDAELIVRALTRLPGGTWDRVLVKMLEAHTSVLRVQFPPFRTSNEVEKQEDVRAQELYEAHQDAVLRHHLGEDGDLDKARLPWENIGNQSFWFALAKVAKLREPAAPAAPAIEAVVCRGCDTVGAAATPSGDPPGWNDGLCGDCQGTP